MSEVSLYHHRSPGCVDILAAYGVPATSTCNPADPRDHQSPRPARIDGFRFQVSGRKQTVSVCRFETGLVGQNQTPPQVPGIEERATLHWEHGRPGPRISRAILRLMRDLLFREPAPPPIQGRPWVPATFNKQSPCNTSSCGGSSNTGTRSFPMGERRASS